MELLGEAKGKLLKELGISLPNYFITPNQKKVDVRKFLAMQEEWQNVFNIALGMCTPILYNM